MGQLVYNAGQGFELDDRVLAHLQIVIAAKLRRHESLFLTLQKPLTRGSGRQMIWIHPSANLVFEFSGNKPPSVNRRWIDELMTTANSVQGLLVIPEPIADQPSEPSS